MKTAFLDHAKGLFCPALLLTVVHQLLLRSSSLPPNKESSHAMGLLDYAAVLGSAELSSAGWVAGSVHEQDQH